MGGWHIWLYPWPRDGGRRREEFADGYLVLSSERVLFFAKGPWERAYHLPSRVDLSLDGVQGVWYSNHDVSAGDVSFRVKSGEPNE